MTARLAIRNLDRFEDAGISLWHPIQPGTQLILNISGNNSTLRRTPDLLPPKLICGEVGPSELDVAVPKEAAA